MRVSVGLWLVALAAFGCQKPFAAEKNLRPLEPTSPSASPSREGPGQAQAEPCGLPPGLREPNWPLRLEQTTPGEPIRTAGSLTLAALPDTQYYVSCRSSHLKNQAEWLVKRAQDRNIGLALTLGDLTEHNEEAEWRFLKESLAPAVSALPFIFTVGNHDYGLRGSADHRNSLFSKFVSGPGPQLEPALAQSIAPGQLENAYYRFEVQHHPESGLTLRPLGALNPLGAQDSSQIPNSPETRSESSKKTRAPAGFVLGILSLEWSPRASTVAWAREVLRAFPRDQRVLVSHAYLYFDDTRYDFARRGPEQKWNPLTYGTQTNEGEDASGHDGEMLWHELVEPDAGFFLTLNGHVLGDGSGKLSSMNRAGRVVHQLLANYQMLEEGGLGYLRLLELDPDARRILVHTFSPSLGQTSHAPDQEFSLDLGRSLFDGAAKVP
jgi:hypothetical protein